MRFYRTCYPYSCLGVNALQAQAGVQKAWADAKNLKNAKRKCQAMFDALQLRGVRLGADTYGCGGQKCVAQTNMRKVDNVEQAPLSIAWLENYIAGNNHKLFRLNHRKAFEPLMISGIGSDAAQVECSLLRRRRFTCDSEFIKSFAFPPKFFSLSRARILGHASGFDYATRRSGC